MTYSKMFNLETPGVDTEYDRSGPTRLADRSQRAVYEYTPEIELAINVALATGRPLLVRGPSGSGKSSLARAVASRMGWRYYETTITSKTRAQDLLWKFDTLRRLNDAQADEPMKETSDYIRPGPLWWAFDRESAAKFGKDLFEPQPDSPNSVVLIDEIDKAEPDVPNNLLLPLGSLSFYVTDLQDPLPVFASMEHPPLMIITTNEERQLPMAFMRRCIVVSLPSPDAERLKRIAILHFGDKRVELYDALAKEFIRIAESSGRSEPNAAEFLDAVWTCISLKVSLPLDGEESSALWKLIREVTFVKPQAYTRL